MTPRIAILALLAFAATTATAQSILPTKGQVVAGTGDQVPGLPVGITYNNMDTAVMDLDGNMLFSTSLLGSVTTVDNRALLYGRTASDLVLVARSGGPEPTGTLPGVNLVRWISLATPAANTIGSGYRISPQGGILLWGAGLTGTGIVNAGTTLAGKNDACLFWGPVGGQAILAQRGDFTPGGGGSQLDTAFTSVSGQTSSMNANGTAVFQTNLVGGDVVASPSNNIAYLIGVPGNLQIMLRKGDAFPITGGNALIGAIGFNVQINDAGQVFHDEKFSTTLGTAVPLPTTANDGVLMLYTPGSGNQIVAREGDPAPGTAGASYSGFTMATIGLTRSGRMSFYADLVGGDVSGTTNNGAIYTGTAAGGFTMAARRGDPAPSAAGDTFTFFSTSSINIVDDGSMLFYAGLAGASVTTANDQCLVGGTPGNLQIIAREGDAAPGVVGGVLGPVSAGTAHLNDRGQAIFGCDVYVASTLVGGATWAYDPNQGLILLSMVNDIYTTASGTLVANGVDGGIQTNSGDGCPLTLNNNGDFVRRISTGNGVGCAVRGMLGGLQASPASVSANGGTQSFELNAGIANAGRLYVLAGTLSGTRPGFNFNGSHIALNQDAWFNLSLQAANGAVYTNTWGLLDANGQATASFNFPAGFNYFVGATFHHAFVALNLSTVVPTFVSQPASVRLY